eukprot:g1626.t1
MKAAGLNAESSRSHLVFSILIEYTDLMNHKTNIGKLSLIDLAGFERHALSSGEKFIPYRNNILTQLMSDSLGGNAKTLMFVNISPADYNAPEAQTSLVYASRVKLIKNDASKQSDSEEVAKLKRIIKQLRETGSSALLDEEEGGGEIGNETKE